MTGKIWRDGLARAKPLKLFTREELLADMARMPDDAYASARHAAAFLGVTLTTLANWRYARRGPVYEGAGRFIRYKIRSLKAFMAHGAGEVDGEHGQDRGSNKQ